MSRRIPTREVLSFLGITEDRFLRRLRREGLFLSDELEPDQAEDLRFAQVLMEELGVNASGVGVALHLRRRLVALEKRTRALAEVVERRSRPEGRRGR